MIGNYTGLASVTKGLVNAAIVRKRFWGSP
jgi:hypothetical protein